MVFDYNQNNNYRGLHIVVLNPKNGKVETTKVFDTYKSSENFDKFICNKIPKNHIIVAACKDECTNRLSQTAKSWFAAMGSNKIWNLEYRQGFAFIGIMGESN